MKIFVMFALLLVAAFALPSTSRNNDLGPASSRFPSPQFFEQQQDHFDPTNANTWQQAYYVNDTFWVPGSKAPVFICVGGEGPPLDGSVVVASVHCNIAVEWLEETKGLMFAVEHRYYGCHNMSACPVDRFDRADALRFLSSRQALSDLARFHQFATDEYNLTPDNKWVSWGGSYPGMLAGWFRYKFPHLVHASVASSAPVHAQVDMRGYFDVLAQAYNATSVGGSPECLGAISKGHATIGAMMNGTDADREKLGTLFNIPSPQNLKMLSFQREFAGYGVFPFPGQENDPACEDPLCNIAKICDVMVDESVGDELDRLAKLRNGVEESHVIRARGGLGARWKGEGLLGFGRAAVEPDYWGWQTCNEFGFYQTCEVGSKCMFTQGLATLDVEIAFCSSLFGIDKDTVEANVAFTNVFYGADHPDATRILWPNGEVDPWHALSILGSATQKQPTLWVVGSSHHFWTHPSLATDDKYIVKARNDIRTQVAAWLLE